MAGEEKSKEEVPCWVMEQDVWIVLRFEQGGEMDKNFAVDGDNEG